MEIFGYSIEKKSTTFGGGFGIFQGLGAYEEKPMNFNTYYDMYLRNADVKSCVNELMKTAGKSGFKVLKKGKVVNGNQELVEENSIFISEFLKNSADVKYKVDDWVAFNILKKEVIKHYKISGNLFALKKKNKIGKINGIKILDSRNVNIVTNHKLEVLYYLVRNGGEVYTVTSDNMFHFISTSGIKDDVYGDSELSGIIYNAYSDVEASTGNYFAMLNNSVPAGLYILKDGIEQDTAEKIVMDIKKEVKGSKNRNKTIVSNAVQDFKALAQTHKDMDYVAMQEFNSEKICSALGVPRIILNYTNKIQVGNGETQYKKYIENTIRPLEFDLNCIFTTIISEILPDRYFEIIDDHINDKIDKIEMSERMVKIGLWNRNEGRDYLGEAIIEDNDLMNEYTVDANTKLLTDLEFDLNEIVNEDK